MDQARNVSHDVMVVLRAEESRPTERPAGPADPTLVLETSLFLISITKSSSQGYWAATISQTEQKGPTVFIRY